MNTRTRLFSALAGWLSLAVLLVNMAVQRLRAAEPSQAPAVLVVTAEIKDISSAVEFVGRVKATDRVDLRARVTGFLGPRLFKDGDVVAESQVLFSIESAPFEAVVNQRRAAVQSAEATARLAELQATRGRELLRTNALAQSQVDEREADLSRARADLALAQAALQEASINLSYTRIQSPIAGRIGDAAVSPGNLVSPQSGVLAVVVRLDPVEVTFPVPQRRLLEARRQSPDIDLTGIVATLRLADGSRYDERGQVNFIGVQADPRTDTILMRAVFPNPRRILDDGMSVRVLLEAAKPEQALVIPQSAIQQDQAGAYVLAVETDNKAVLRRVMVENQRDGSTVVREGLKAGESVIVQGQGRVRPGMVVAPSPMPAEGS